MNVDEARRPAEPPPETASITPLRPVRTWILCSLPGASGPAARITTVRPPSSNRGRSASPSALPPPRMRTVAGVTVEAETGSAKVSRNSALIETAAFCGDGPLPPISSGTPDSAPAIRASAATSASTVFQAGEVLQGRLIARLAWPESVSSLRSLGSARLTLVV